MNALEASRALNVLQDKMLKDSVGEEEFVKAQEKAKVQIERALAGQSEFFSDFGDIGIEYDELGRAQPSIPVDMRPLPPATLPTDDEENPFPGLERPLG